VEETGIQVKNVAFWQPAVALPPGDDRLYRAARGRRIIVDTNELEEADWFTRTAMPMLLPLSIARLLVDDWLRPPLSRGHR
jgi:NADH pyrophosphatase NudC (nudix superfamily)